jgi:hypothetical protein
MRTQNRHFHKFAKPRENIAYFVFACNYFLDNLLLVSANAVNQKHRDADGILCHTREQKRSPSDQAVLCKEFSLPGKFSRSRVYMVV